jgi:ubiquinone/menaquinone biosynthesis C-methylase UbiE
MNTATATRTGSEFVDFWNEILAPKFNQYRHILVGGLARHSERIFPSLELNPGDKAVDIGCGYGDTAIEIARRVGPSGSVLGIDCCEAFLAIGREDVAARNVTNVELTEGDAQTYPFDGTFDFCFSRFGTQFFENPVAGLRNMRTSLKPAGIMTMTVWRTIDDNPWLGLPKQIAASFLPEPGDDARTCGPGPFSMADQEMVTRQLEIAGYDEIRVERIDALLMVGNTIEDAINFQLALGPAGEIYREAGEIATQREAEIRAALDTELKKYLTPDGIVMQSSSWKVRARNPG